MRTEMGGIAIILGVFGIAGAIETNENPIPAIILIMLGLLLVSKEVARNYEAKKKNRDNRKLDFSDIHDASYPSFLQRR